MVSLASSGLNAFSSNTGSLESMSIWAIFRAHQPQLRFVMHCLSDIQELVSIAIQYCDVHFCHFLFLGPVQGRNFLKEAILSPTIPSSNLQPTWLPSPPSPKWSWSLPGPSSHHYQSWGLHKMNLFIGKRVVAVPQAVQTLTSLSRFFYCRLPAISPSSQVSHLWLILLLPLWELLIVLTPVGPLQLIGTPFSFLYSLSVTYACAIFTFSLLLVLFIL